MHELFPKPYGENRRFKPPVSTGCNFLSGHCRVLPSLDGVPPEWYVSRMSISLSPDLAERVQQKVKTADYRSPDEVIREALDALDAKEQSEPPLPLNAKKSQTVPVWERFQNAVRAIPDEELSALPPDGASEHDHYLYGTPKRSA